MFNTLRSSLGYMVTLIEKHSPLDLSKDSLEGVFNLHQINAHLYSAGQPTEQQFVHIKEAGIRHIINLAPSHGENALPDESRTVSELGMQYHHIPVDYRRPSEDSFTRFCDVMNALEGETKLVHCAANMRASAFIYRYRRQELGEDRDVARKDMEVIWRPFGPWKRFIRDTDN